MKRRYVHSKLGEEEGGEEEKNIPRSVEVGGVVTSSDGGGMRVRK